MLRSTSKGPLKFDSCVANPPPCPELKLQFVLYEIYIQVWFVYQMTYILNDYEHRYLPVCVCSLILTRSTGHATISWAAPPAEPARNICVYDPKFWVLAEDSIARRDVPYTPKNREFIAPADKIGYHIPLNSPRIYDDIHTIYLSFSKYNLSLFVW